MYALKALSKVLLNLRAEMTSAAEQQVIASAAQKEESLNVQMLIDRQTKDLKVRAHSHQNVIGFFWVCLLFCVWCPCVCMCCISSAVELVIQHHKI